MKMKQFFKARPLFPEFIGPSFLDVPGKERKIPANIVDWAVAMLRLSFDELQKTASKFMVLLENGILSDPRIFFAKWSNKWLAYLDYANTHIRMANITPPVYRHVRGIPTPMWGHTNNQDRLFAIIYLHYTVFSCLMKRISLMLQDYETDYEQLASDYLEVYNLKPEDFFGLFQGKIFHDNFLEALSLVHVALYSFIPYQITQYDRVALIYIDDPGDYMQRIREFNWTNVNKPLSKK